MALVVARIDCQSSNTVKGTPSRSQYVMRSGAMSVRFASSHFRTGRSPCPFLAKSKSVSLAADRSDTPSPA